MATLDPRRFTAAQYVDISASPLRSQFRRMRSMQVADPHRRQFGDQLATSDVPFPPATRGFLYFFSPPAQSPLAGGVRFRVVPQAPAPNRVGPAFAAGHDLLMAHGLPWHLPVWEILTRRAYSCLRDVLVKDELAPGRLRLACNSLSITRDSVLVTALGMPWAVDWSTEFSRIYVVAPHHHPVAAMVRHPWYSRASERKAPYSGTSRRPFQINKTN
ncbi:hypothetical protein GGX14DRAFT_352860 [Mycena pura]|uniref:Uncharacterized protein n=1 Tax=Mycena pura TaxID=153505 RepID=A0AAD6YKT4_9AGAR|nr:hypothetical protein GGX14DRAFT_352860 [Mycena pura]